MNQDDIAHFCATQITFGLERDPDRVSNFLNQTARGDFLDAWRQFQHIEGISEGLVAIYAEHSPRYASKNAKFNENGAQYTWHRCRDFLVKFAAQEDGCKWRLQKPENSKAFLRHLRIGLAKHLAAKSA